MHNDEREECVRQPLDILPRGSLHFRFYEGAGRDAEDGKQKNEDYGNSERKN